MIDLHSHVLPNLDDRAKNIEEAVEVCRMAAGDSIQILAATPQYRPNVYENEKENILPAFGPRVHLLQIKSLSWLADGFWASAIAMAG